MKIGISCYPTIGGSGVVASELGMGLADRGHEVHFISYDVPNRLDECRSGICCHVVTVPEYPLFEYPPYGLALASKMSDVATREGLELIHCHYAIPHAASALLARSIVGGRDSLRVVTTLHGTDITLVGRDESFLPVTRHSIEESDAVSAVSRFLKDEIYETFTCEKEISVVHNFVDPNDYKQLRNEELRNVFAPANEKLLVHVSNFRKVKRVHDVVDIFLKVRKHIPARLILVGSGPELPLVKQIAQQAGVEQDLVLLGNRDRVLDIIAACDLLLQPSQTESFGLTALEAMACGVPPIATRTGGVPEVIEDRVTGYLFPVGDTDGMSEKALELLTNDEKRKSIGRGASQRAFEVFGIDAALDGYEELYQKALR